MAGIPGGLFSPTLSIGAGVAHWVHAAVSWAPMPAVITGIPMMATALIASRISAFFTPPLYEALAESDYFHVGSLPTGSFLQKRPVPPPGA